MNADASHPVSEGDLPLLTQVSLYPRLMLTHLKRGIAYNAFKNTFGKLQKEQQPEVENSLAKNEGNRNQSFRSEPQNKIEKH